ncbi:flagellar FliL protein [Micromonospora pattaloongensis]|uniref:Flagellar protein FliL n=1 Tax=Micromonospora pattaloongensis TaxID=405436 RepID=A0A1H3MZP2_9ACTN|nr:flagellar basal body-associated FliL family protein [Micromonospora pattaloongensis]SDY81449.1 flagellar FliL protein [Micromonospora pattaloongensis]
MSKNDKSDADEATPKKSKKLLMLLLAVVLLLAGAAGGYFMLAGPASGSDTPPPPEPGAVVAMDAVTVNLADGHYLKMRIALQATADAHAEPDGSKALDLAITKYTDMQIGELSSAAGRAKAKAELLAKIKEAYDGEIMDVYFTEFVMQ